MQTHSSPSMQLTKRRAAFRLRQLLDECHLLLGSFPDLQDAFDPDELPLEFIFRRDSQLTGDGVKPDPRSVGNATSGRKARSSAHHTSAHRRPVQSSCANSASHPSASSRRRRGC